MTVNKRHILDVLESRLSGTLTEIAELLGVSSRTIANQITVLNVELEGVAQIVQIEGSRRLEVLDPEGYRRFKMALVPEGTDLNDPAARQAAVFHLLASRKGPVFADVIARSINVSRSTVNADLNRLREVVRAYGLEIVGRTNAGVALRGTELHIRLAMLDRFAGPLLDPSPVPEKLVHEVVDLCEEIELGVAAIDSVSTWFTIMFVRLRDGFAMDGTDESLGSLTSNRASTHGARLAGLATDWLSLEASQHEALFMTLPLVGMRGPKDPLAFESFLAVETHEELYRAIMARIHDDMGIDLKATQLREEFLAHLGFLLNRVQYGIQVTQGSAALLRDRYPLAHRVAMIAQSEIERATGREVAEAEVSLLAAYFQIFVNRTRTDASEPLRVAAVYANGKAEGELLRLQVVEAVGAYGSVTAVSESDIHELTETEFDLAVAHRQCVFDAGELPIVRVGMVFDVSELRRKIGALAMTRGWSRRMALGGASWLGTLLEPQAFVRLKSDEYGEALEELLGELRHRGLAGPELIQAVHEREARSTMRLFPRLAFPHVVAPTGDLLLSVGVSDAGQGLVIVLLAVPDAAGDESSSLLLGLYEEIVGLAQDEDAVSAIISADSAARFRTVMAVQATELLREK